MSTLETVTRNDLLQPGLSGAFVREGFGASLPCTRTGDKLAGMRMGAKDVFLVQDDRLPYRQYEVRLKEQESALLKHQVHDSVALHDP